MAKIGLGKGQLFTKDGRVASIGYAEIDIDNDLKSPSKLLLEVVGTMQFIFHLNKDGFKKLVGIHRINVYSKLARKQKWRRKHG